MKRPALTDNSFLGHIFSPKKNAVPTGLRKVKLKGARGTKKSRVAAFNRMSPVNQELLKRAGTRDAYLKGEGTLADAKRKLRDVAVRAGIAKPARVKPAVGNARRDALRALIARHIAKETRDAGLFPNERTIDENIDYLEPTPDMARWDYGRIKYAGRRESEYEVIVEGKARNPFWYH